MKNKNLKAGVGALAALCLILSAGTFYLYRSYVKDKAALKEVFIKEEKSKAEIKGRQIEQVFSQIYQGARTISLLPSIRSLKGGNLPKGFPAKFDATRFSTDAQLTVQQIYNNMASNVSVSEVYAVLKGFRPDLGETPFFMFDTLIVQSGASAEEGAHAHEHFADTDTPEEYEGDEYSFYIRQLSDMGVKYPVFTKEYADDIETIPLLGSPVMRTCDNSQYLSKKAGNVKDAEGMLFSAPIYSMEGRRELVGLVSVIVRKNVFEALLMDRPFVPVTENDMRKMREEKWEMPIKPVDIALKSAESGAMIFDRRNKGFEERVARMSSGPDAEFVVKRRIASHTSNGWELVYLADVTALGARVSTLTKMFAMKICGFILAALGVFCTGLFTIAQRASLSRIGALNGAISSDKEYLEGRVGHLLDVVSRAGGGDLGARAEIVEGSEEIVELTRGINLMLENTGRSREAIEGSRATLQACMGEVFTILNSVAEGDYSRRAEGNYDDEMMDKLCGVVNRTAAELDRAVSEIRDYKMYLERNIASILGVMKAVASGDMTRAASAERDDEVGMLVSAINESISNLDAMLIKTGSLAGVAMETAEEIAASSRKSSETSAATAATIEQIFSLMEIFANHTIGISNQTQNQAASIEEVSATIEELLSSVQMNAGSAKAAAGFSEQNTASAREGGDLVKRLVAGMGEIMASSEEISQIIEMVSDFAEQTNLLSLNAAIEAARAGAHGLGFTVVADEVRRLADNSARAAKDIGKLIKESVKSIDAGSNLARDAESKIVDIIEKASQSEIAIQSISAATEEQARAVEQISMATESLNETTQEINQAALKQSDSALQITQSIEELNKAFQMNAELISINAASSEAMSRQARELAGLISEFKTTGASSKETGLALI